MGTIGMFVSLCFWMCFLAPFPQCTAKLSGKERRQLENIHRLIYEEISTLKTKVWGEMATEIEELKERLNTAMENDSFPEQQVFSVNENITEEVEKLKQQLGAEQKLRQELENNLMSCTCEKIDAFSDAFQFEKLKTRKLEAKILNVTTTLNNFQNKNAEEIEALRGRVAETIENQTDTLLIIEKLEEDCETVLNQQENITKVISQTRTAKSNSKTKKTFGKPGFVSDWILMKSQDEKLSQITVAHGLGALPYKVDVQTRQTHEGKWWIFPGVSAFQSDDDTSRPYGGVVYFYNVTHITLFAPKKNNNNDQGKIIHTGADKYTGNNHESSSEAYVRIKAWGSENMPAPDFESDRQNLDIYNKENSFYEIDHHLNDYPALVTVHVLCELGSYSLVSDGIGATVKPRGMWSAGGGVGWAFSNKSVRIWTLYDEKADIKMRSQTLFGSKDGWGVDSYIFQPFTLEDFKQGYAVVRAWSKNLFQDGINFFQHDQSLSTIRHSPMRQDSLESDLFFLSVQAEDGVNKGYRFSGYGGAQAQNQPYGGVVYAYSRDGGVRVWSPDTDQHGYSVHIHSPYGNGVNVQATNNVSYVTTWIRS